MNDPRNHGNSAFDLRTILAVGLSMVVIIGWQYYLSVKYPKAAKPKDSAEVALSSKENPSSPSKAGSERLSSAPIEREKIFGQLVPNGSLNKEVVSEVLSPNISFEISSKGMALKNVVLKNYKDRDGKPVLFSTSGGLFGTGVLGEEEPIDFEVHEVKKWVFEGRAIKGNTTISKTIELLPEVYQVKETVRVSSPSADFKGIYIGIQEKFVSGESSSFLSPPTDTQDIVYVEDGAIERKHLTSTSSSQDELNSKHSASSLMAVSSRYFAAALRASGDFVPDVFFKVDKSTVVGRAEYPSLIAMKDFEVAYVGYIGPKSVEVLETVDSDFTQLVDFGFFSGIAKILLRILKIFHRYIGNWGLAIISLTVLVRILVLPFVIMSFRSMKKMQNIQPMINALREKHKENPSTLNTEMMNLMRTHKVNPLGGCLPMLLQLPIFFALYQVLGQSIELYQAPFFGWISDLSLRDPLYILPVLMGLAMFVQQKITPSTMDPTQAKILQFMPIVFSFLMISLPSGLTLYIFVSTFFGVLQQMLFMYDKPKNTMTTQGA